MYILQKKFTKKLMVPDDMLNKNIRSHFIKSVWKLQVTHKVFVIFNIQNREHTQKAKIIEESNAPTPLTWKKQQPINSWYN